MVLEILSMLKEQEARLDYLEELIKSHIESTRNLRNEG